MGRLPIEQDRSEQADDRGGGEERSAEKDRQGGGIDRSEKG